LWSGDDLSHNIGAREKSPLRRRFAASVWIWQASVGSNDAEDQALFEKISNFGFDGVEIPSFEGYLEVAKIRDRLFSIGRLTPIVIGGGSKETDLSSDSNSTRAKARAYIKRLIDICSDLDGELVCGPLYSAVGTKRLLSEDSYSKVLKVVAEELRSIGDYARERSVRLAIEPLCRYDTHLINTVKQGKELVDLTNHESVGLLLDTFHLNIEEKSIGRAIRLSGEKLFHFHACENDRGIPGKGTINWIEVKGALADLKYSNWISIESFVPDKEGFSSSMNVWRHIELDQDEIAKEGLSNLKRLLAW
jgi:D-psicose/D-tagatose/L-ribulose 3-epimerase